MKQFKTIICLFALILGFVSVTQAEEKAEKRQATELEKTVVTATKTEIAVEDAPASVVVVSKEEIEMLNVQTFNEALMHLSGVQPWRLRPLMAGDVYINLRGMPSQVRTLVLLDGQPLNNPLYGQVMWHAIPVGQVERVEVVKGPFSSLYGGNAMGGVINIITKTPEKSEFILKSSYGSDNTQIYRLSYGNKVWDKLSFSLGYDRRISDGYISKYVTKSAKTGSGAIEVTGFEPTTDRKGKPCYLVGDAGKYETEADTFNGKLTFWINPLNKLSFTMLHDEHDNEYEKGHSYLRDVNTGEPVGYEKKETVTLAGEGKKMTVYPKDFIGTPGEQKNELYTLQYEGVLGKIVDLRCSLGFYRIPEKWYVTGLSTNATWEGGAGKVSKNEMKSWYGNIQSNFYLGSHTLTTGFDYRTGWGESKKWTLSNWRDEGSKTGLLSKEEGEDKTWAFFVQDQWKLHPKLTAFLGLRYDHWTTSDGMHEDVEHGIPRTTYGDRSDDQVSPKLALVYKPFEQTTLRTSAGKSFRAPTIYDLYHYYYSTYYVTEPNPDLKPETNTAWEIGASQKLPTGTEISVTYFENYLDDLIYNAFDPSDPTGKTKRKFNAAKAEIKGVEFDVRQKITTWVSAFGNFTYYDAKITDNSLLKHTEGKHITMVPQKMYNLGLDFSYWKTKARLIGRYVDKLYAEDDNSDTVTGVYGSYDDYFVVDFKGSIDITKNASLSFSVNNIFDEEYYSYYEMPGTTCYGELTLKF